MPFGRNPGGGALQRAARVLATADSVAHAAFFSMFVWRTIAGSGLRVVQGVCALLAGIGFAAGVVGSMLVKHGGRTKVRTLGLYGIALSTALAGVLLVVANWTGGD